MILTERSKALKRTVIAMAFAGLLVPFVSFKDIYPFYRFGMFAEPAYGSDRKSEVFFARYQVNGTKLTLDPQTFGMPDSQWQALSRNYFYRGEGKMLLQNFQQLQPETTHWELLQVSFRAGLPSADTVLVVSLTSK